MIYAIGLISVVLAVALDQFTKYLAIKHLQNNPITVIEGVFQFRYLENKGAAFGMFQNQQLFFLIIGTITLIFIAILYVRMPLEKRYLPLRICMLSITAGAIGNMIDRARFKYVVDFLYFELIDFPIFNVADIFATVATFVLIFLLMFYYKEKDIDMIFQLMKPNFKNKNKQAD